MNPTLGRCCTCGFLCKLLISPSCNYYYSCVVFNRCLINCGCVCERVCACKCAQASLPWVTVSLLGQNPCVPWFWIPIQVWMQSYSKVLDVVFLFFLGYIFKYLDHYSNNTLTPSLYSFLFHRKKRERKTKEQKKDRKKERKRERSETEIS